LEWGESEQWLRDLAAEGDTPRALLEKPEIEEHLVFVWNAFWAISSDRPIGAMGGIGSIPFAAIDRYASRYGIDGRDEFDRFHTLIKRLDAVFIATANEKAAEEAKKGK
jgi:hypothetical protein